VPLRAFGCFVQECDPPCEATFTGCAPGQLLSPSGLSAPWLATDLATQTSTLCGPACDVPACVTPGAYTVTLCASLTLASTGDGVCTAGEQRCVSIDFDVPLTETVITGEISP